MTEDELIRWLKSRASGLGGERIGDDAAVLPAGGPWVTTVDTQIEGVHFFPGLGADLLARRLLAVNLSDLAAMGAEPAHGFLALSAPSSFDHRLFFESFLEGCSVYGLELSGGDLSTQSTVTAVLTLIGRRPAGCDRFVRRSDARAGHRLWLGGAVGESALGFELLRSGKARVRGNPANLEVDLSLAGLSKDARETAERSVRCHVLPQPQLELGQWVAGRKQGGGIDLSDGLAKDLRRLCEAAEVSARVDLEALPEPVGWPELRDEIGQDWLPLALGGGEDYVLCFTLSADEQPPGIFESRLLGEIRAGSGVTGVLAGRETVIEPMGWDHLQGSD